MPADKIRAGVIGWPVSHSLSPRLHGYWLRQYHIDGTYEAIAAEPQDFERTLKRLLAEGYAGANVTLPHKERALECVDEADAFAQRLGAVNTIVIRGGRLFGSNTDAYGFIQNLRAHQVQPEISTALVLGAGGAARAVCAGLLDAGASVTLAARTRAKAENIAQALGGRRIDVVDWEQYTQAMERASLLVNATSLGMKGGEPLRVSLNSLNPRAVVTDIVYNPLITPFLQDAQARGHVIVDGLGMLLYQAQLGFEAWFGTKPQVTEALRRHVLEEFL